MTSQPGYQTITMHILPNISRSKCNQTVKFDQLIQYNKMFLFKNHAENESGRLVLDLFNFFKKPLYQVKASGLQLSFTKFRQPSNWHTIKLSCIKLYPHIRSILIFFRKDFGNGVCLFLHHILCMIFQEKYFSFYILFTDQISLSDCFYFLRYWVICVLQSFVSSL